MIAVLRVVAQDEVLLDSLDRLLERPRLRNEVHGVAVAFDLFWLSAANLILMSDMSYGYARSCYREVDLWQLYPDEVTHRILDLCQFWRPTTWNRHCEFMGYQEKQVPILIKIITRDQNLNLRESDLPTVLESRFGAHPLVYEHRPPCIGVTSTSTLSLRPASSIGQTSPPIAGTMGGFIKDKVSSRHYGVTCAHVLRKTGTTVVHPGPAQGTNQIKIGTTDFSEMPPQISATQMCNSRSSFTRNNLDLATASLDPNIVTPMPSLGYPSSVLSISQMSTGQEVRFDGQVSGSVDAKIDDLNLWRTILIDKRPHCFGDIFSIVPRKSPYFNFSLAKPGDSGSWVIHDNQLSQGWAGIVIADDGLKAYCCFAEHVVNRLSRHFGGAGRCVLP